MGTLNSTFDTFNKVQNGEINSKQGAAKCANQAELRFTLPKNFFDTILK